MKHIPSAMSKASNLGLFHTWHLSRIVFQYSVEIAIKYSLKVAYKTELLVFHRDAEML